MNFTMLSVISDLWECASLLPFAQAPDEWGWRMHPMWGWGWGAGMMAMMLFFWEIILVAAVLCIRWFFAQTKPSRGDSAIEILRERFARGEIEKDEFEAKKTALK